MELPEITDIKRLTLRPGDRIAVHLDHLLDDQQFDQLHVQFRKFFGPDVQILLIEPGINITVLGAPQPDGA